MANGKEGDHPITDITVYRKTVFGAEIDAQIAALAADGRSGELGAEVDLWTRRAGADLAEQLAGIAARDHRSVRVLFDWTSAAVREPRPWGGWSYTSSVQLSDPADGDEAECWAMRFHIDPIAYPDGSKRAFARFLSDSGPWEELVPGTRFWMRFAHRVTASGRVISHDEPL